MIQKTPPVIRLLIVDDSPLVRAGLKAVFESQPSVKILGEAATAAAALAAHDKLLPDVVLLDINLPDKSGIEVCREILKRRELTRVIILSSAADEKSVNNAIGAGAHGYLLKENDGPSLVEAIGRVYTGQSVLDPVITAQVMQMVKTPRSEQPSNKLGLLSPQETRVLALLSQGLTNKEIGNQLGLTEKTVKNYMANLFDKLNITRRTQAVALYTQTKQ